MKKLEKIIMIIGTATVIAPYPSLQKQFIENPNSYPIALFCVAATAAILYGLYSIFKNN